MPNWQLALFALAFVATSIGLSVSGLLATRGLIKRQLSPGHQSVASSIFLTAVGFYSILLAFVVYIVWQRFSASDQAVTEEAAALIGVFRDTQTFPEPFRSEAQQALEDYAQVGTPAEWSTGGNELIRPHNTPDLLNGVWDVYRQMDKAPGLHGAYLDAVERLRTLENRRHLRHLASQSTLNGVFWGVLVLGAVITTLLWYTCYMDNMWMQLALTILAASLGGIIFFLIWALNTPFQGPVRISQGAFQHAVQQFHAMELPPKR